MQKKESYETMPSVLEQDARKIEKDGTRKPITEELLSEWKLTIAVNGTDRFTVTCTAQDLEELAVGHLFCEGIIEDAEEISEVILSESGRRAEVILQKREHRRKEEKEYQPFQWNDAWIRTLSERFAQDLPLFQKTRSAHCCFLMTEGSIVFQCEDLKRHNVVDKAIGYALLHGLDLRQTVLYISGRMPVDMVSKVIRAGIPLLASKAVPTKEAVELASSCGLTLIGRAKEGSFIVYTEEKKNKKNIAGMRSLVYNDGKMVFEGGKV